MARFFQNNSCSITRSQRGFSLIEVLIGLVLSGLLMSMVAMVLGQSITNNEVVRSSSGLSSRMFTLRRVLHRDLQNILVGKTVFIESEGFGLQTTNNFLIDGGVGVEVIWDFSGNMIRRRERSESLDYENSFQMLRGLKSSKLELLDGAKGVWISSVQYQNRPLNLKSAIKAIRISFTFEDGNSLLIVERIPYALS